MGAAQGHPRADASGHTDHGVPGRLGDGLPPTQAKLLVELQWNPEWKAARVIESDGQPFGSKATQYNFIRDPQAMVAIGRSALALLVSHYSDDTWGLEPDYAALHAWKIWLELHKIIGWRLDLDESLPPEYTFRLLGADLHVGAEQPVGILPASKALKLEKDIDACLQAGTMTSAQASSLRGKFQCGTFAWGRWGAAVLGPLACRQGSGRRSLNPALIGALNAAKEVLRHL